MRIVENIRIVIWVLSILCSLRFSLQFEPPDNYLIDCGSSSDVSVNDRKFVADGFNSSFLETPNDISVKNRSSIAISSTFGSALFETARIFNETSDYTFPIRKPGRHWIRLYFYPLVNKNYNLSMAKFSVSAQGFTLLKDHQIQNDTLVKEYSVNISSNSLVLTFTPSANSSAFINALEVVSQPDHLLPKEARTIGSQGRYRNLQKQALETVERVNMGNVAVPPQNDILGRLWVSDGSYLAHNSSVMFVSKEDAVDFTTGSSKEIAPSSVYGTATALNTTEGSTINVNITWNFDVNPGFEYLIRFHFCDIVSSSTQNRLSKVYVNSWSVSRNFDLSNQTLNSFGTPYFIDVVEMVSNNPQLKVSIGPFSADEQFPLVFLNGLEIMKVSDSRGGLDVSDSFKSSSKTKIAVIVGLSAGLFIAVVLAMLIFIVCRRRRKLALVGHSKTEDVAVIGMENNHVNRTGISGLKTGYRFPLSVIQKATDNFSENLVIGVGGFGKVYEGVLSDNTKVAVKRGVSESNQGLREFWTEIEMLSQFRHRHLVSLIGYCDEQNEMIIIYEFMENGTVKNHLYGSDVPTLSWRQRLEICIGSARGLHYLHTGSTKAIIHRDVKSANILLDENFMAKVADFGLSKTGPEIDKTHVSTAVKGSFGYLDPEYLTRQQLTEKSDVYSFGVVMYEILCGRPVIDPSLPREKVNLVDWAMKWQRRGQLEEVVDPRIADQIKPDSLKKFGEIAEKCLAENSVFRPTMGDVLWNLEYVLQLQGVDKRRSRNDELSSPVDHLETGESTAEFSMGSMGDIAGVSMSKVFAQMMKEEIS
ncbi:probable receptor-like protein kinase At5g59700 [Ziziphus jujuba]|uniref:Probable receptor-like protein kinase At5g59700 n=1 Tax=Ziziphus jujuba TaxID=326968 RepID=A0ABM3IDR6_ZIZJJ|nr:probable receptor-like protein kinase At5g59700 [Ziziphus jujuba]